MFHDSNINPPLKPPIQPGISPIRPMVIGDMMSRPNPQMAASIPNNTLNLSGQNQYASSPVRPPLTVTYQNHSSLNSSRNSSPALSQTNLNSNHPIPNQLKQNNIYQSNYTPAPVDNKFQPGPTPQNYAGYVSQNQTNVPPNNMMTSNPQMPPTSYPQQRTNPVSFPPSSSNPQTHPPISSATPQYGNTQVNSFLNQQPINQNNFHTSNVQSASQPPMNFQSLPNTNPPLSNQSMSGPAVLPPIGTPSSLRQINPTLPPLIPNQAPPMAQSGINPSNYNQRPPTNIQPPPMYGNLQGLPAQDKLSTDNNQINLPNNRLPLGPNQNAYNSAAPLAPPYSMPPQMSTQPNMPPHSSAPPMAAPGNQQQGNINQYPSAGTNLATPHFNGQQDLTNQMGRLSVTQGGINKIWGHETIDLLQCRNILPETKLETPVVKLNHHFVNSVNCSPDIFRCTVSKIPETNNLLQKSRLPLGILIHPFKDLTHLPVIQCSSIVRCRSCRTYINPFVYFIDIKRWKCNLCYRINDLPEEFQYDPVTRSYGDPTRRPEIQSATIEYIAPSEYMLRPPQPAVYLFLLDVSSSATESGYLKIFCDTLIEQIDNLPGDSRTQLAFMCYDSAVHFYFLGEGASRPKEMTVIDIEDIFLPSPEDLLVNLAERRSAILELLASLPARHSNTSPASTQSALGAALLAAQKLMSPTGGRISVFQTCLTNIGPGALQAREDPNNRSSKDVAHLNPATDFYKRQALNCSGVHVAVDLFLLNSQYADLSTLSGVSRFSGGSIYHIPLFKASRDWQAQELKRCLTRYLTRKIGFEAVMRVRCTRGLAIHAFHGSFFVRSTDLLSLPNVSPDAGFGMQLAIEENLSDAQHVCFQAAVLYTSSKGERRIRVHTLCLPVTSTLSDVIHSADQQCIIGLLAKMAVDRSLSSSLSDAREALINAAVDALGTLKLVSGPSHGLMCSMQLRLLPLYLLALLKCRAFRTGTSTRLDDRVASMCEMKSLPLISLIRTIYPDLYPVHRLSDFVPPSTSNENEADGEENCIPSPPRLRLSAEKVSATGAYLLDQESVMVLYVGHTVHPSWIQNALGVNQHSEIPDDMHTIPTLETVENVLLHSFIDHLNDEKPYAASLHIIRDNSPNRAIFIDRLVDDRVEAALSYYEFLQHVKSLIK